MSTVSPQESRLRTGSLMVLAAVAIGFALTWARPVMIPFVLALLVTYLVAPLVDLAQVRLKFPRWAAVLAALVVGSNVLGLLGLALVTSTRSLIGNADVYRERVTDLAASVLGILDRFHVDLGQRAVIDALQKLPVLDWVQSAAGTVLDLLTTSVLVLIFVIYLLLGRGPHEERRGIWGEIDVKIRGFLLTKVATSAATGALVGVILTLFGLEMAFAFGVLAFLLNFIPSVGAIIATLLPLPIALIQFSNPWAIVGVVLLPGTVQMVVGNAIEPKLLGDSLDLHPVTILLALIFWGLIWGIVGMLLATPITAVLRIVFSRIEMTRPVADLLAGRLPAGDDPEAPPGAADAS